MEEQKLRKRLNKAIRENNEAQIISICTDLANFYMDEGQFDLAIKEYKTVANIYKVKNDKKMEFAIVNRGIGEAYLGLQAFDKALQHQTLYLDIAKELKNKLEEQRALATIGHTYLSSTLDQSVPDKNKIELANRFFKKSLVASQSLNGQVSKLEIADMSARLFANLGLVQDCLGNFNSAVELINKSIYLCKAHDLYEQLQRGYTSLASVLVKMGDHKTALQQYNLAVEAAKKLRDRPSILAGILVSKADILVRLGDFHGAKNTLHKAYKLKISDVKESRTIETNLRAVVTLCHVEDTLLVTDSTDYSSLKSLHEKMGDACCELKQFSKAIEYYKKMLDAALSAKAPDTQLASCYYSLAETFKDNNQFEEAVRYFECELGLCKLFKDSLNTLSKIADTKEAGDVDVTEVCAVYERAIEMCQSEKNTHEEGRMVNRCILYLERQKRMSEAFKWKQKLTELNYESSDSEGETSDAQSGCGVGAEIDLDALTDVSDQSETEDTNSKLRKRSKNFQVRRNIKGETQLHTACIKGQLNVVRHLIEQGHPLNVRDHCGWLPLHEACNNGHFEIVEFLIEKGASIHDRGGTQCGGITPLHDAASNGHLSIVELLLNKGAKAVAKTDEGETALDFLKKWYATASLDSVLQSRYDAIINQMSQALERAGHVTEKNHSQTENNKVLTPNKNMRRSALIGLEDDEDSWSPPKEVTSAVSNMRRSALVGLDDDHVSTSRTQRATDDYRDAIENLRQRSTIKMTRSSHSFSKRSAFVSEDEMIDDWLEDDIGQSAKKRKTNSPPKRQVRNSNEEIIMIDDTSSDFEMMMTDFEELPQIFSHTSPTKSVASSSSKGSTQSSKFVRKKQMKLTNCGHTRIVVEADSTMSPRKSPKKTLSRTNSFEKEKKTSPKINSFEKTVIEPTLSVDVRINNKLYRVPVLLSQISSHTIKWLADQAASRYARKEYMIPSLELETKNGAILADDDPISLLFPMGSTQAEEVQGRIVKWSIPPLIERFKEACQDMGVVANEDLCKTLEELSVTLNLANHALKGSSLAPLCKALNRQTNLIELNLSGNYLTNECFQLLGASLASLENLYKLDLNCTGFKSEHSQILINNLLPDIAYKLTELDLSDNFIGDECFENLAVVTRRFLLKKLNLSGNKFTGKMFQRSAEITLNLEAIEDFNISDNELENGPLLKILSWMNFSKIQNLEVSRNRLSDGFLNEFMNQCIEMPNLKICKMSRCHINDSELFDLLRIAPNIETFDGSYSDSLTSISLRRLLQSNIQNINVYACKNILQYFTDFTKYVDQSSPSTDKSRTLKISLPENGDLESEYLIKMWRQMYGYKTIVELSSRLLYLSLEK